MDEDANVPDEPPLKELFSPDDAASFDQALLPAVLCAASYAKTCWALDVAFGYADPRAWIDESLLRADRYTLARALMLRRTVRPLTATDLHFHNLPPDECLSRGVWRKRDIYQAVCCEAQAENGNRSVHVCIRGTDAESAVSEFRSRLNFLFGYLLGVYPWINRYATAYERLVDAICRYAQDPKNSISRVVLSGHSLGGAAAQTLSARIADHGLPVDVITFGSPGAGWGIGLSVRRLLRGFSDLFTQLFSFRLSRLKRGNNVRIQNYIHPRDPIPWLGQFIYEHFGDTVHSMPVSEFEKFEEDPSFPRWNFAYHNKMRYVTSLISMIPRAREDNCQHGSPPPPALRAFVDALFEALELECSSTESDVATARGTLVAKLRSEDPCNRSLLILQELAPPSMPLASYEIRRLTACVIADSLDLAHHYSAPVHP